MPADSTHPPALLITAGPTHEPIDAVRYIANRSSGRLGVALADAAASRGWPTTLLLGPTPREPAHTDVNLIRFQTADDLQVLLQQHLPTCDVLVMAAAVADFRPRAGADPHTKVRRSESGLSLELEATPDLLAMCAGRRRPGQVLVGFALEPRDRLLASARDKLRRKGVDAIVANPLETMDADTIEAVVVTAQGETQAPAMDKRDFAPWLLDEVVRLRR
ncbi:MAG: hypothetical protein KDA21_07725 [Phycisphaerales bacterium]|nr:hypothetical protein [Phycisphaerales bacterium]